MKVSLLSGESDGWASAWFDAQRAQVLLHPISLRTAVRSSSRSVVAAADVPLTDSMLTNHQAPVPLS